VTAYVGVGVCTSAGSTETGVMVKELANGMPAVRGAEREDRR
jgi:hypothetical protein